MPEILPDNSDASAALEELELADELPVDDEAVDDSCRIAHRPATEHLLDPDADR